MKGDYCPRCNALIVEALTLAGEVLPLDAGAAKDGIVALEHMVSRDRPIAHLAPHIPAEKCSTIRFVPHRTTCRGSPA